MASATIEEDLVGAKLGNPHARNRLLGFLRPRVQRYLAARMRAEGLAAVDDVTQEALWRIWRGLGGCRATTLGQLTSWGLTIARRALADLRREAPPESMPLEGVPLAHLSSEQSRVEILDPVVHIATLAAGREAMRLSPEQGFLLWYRLQASASWEEVAAALSTTPGAAKRRYRRLLLRLAILVRREVLPELERPPPAWLARPPPKPSGQPGGVSRSRRSD